MPIKELKRVKRRAPIKRRTAQNYIIIHRKHFSVTKIIDGKWVERRPGDYWLHGKYERVLQNGKSYRYKSSGKSHFSLSEYIIVEVNY